MTTLATGIGTQNGPLQNTRGQTEKTGAQWQGHSRISCIPGMSAATDLPPCYDTYRKMLRHPTVALCRAATRAMLKAPKWSVEADDGVPDEVVRFIDKTFLPKKADILNQMDWAQYYGFQGFEKIWEMVDGQFSIKEHKPLLADVTAPIVDEHGRVVGVENQGIRLGLTASWLYTHDGEAGNPWGESLLENIRETSYRAWMDTFNKCAQYTTKAAGVITVVKMPLGESTVQDGNPDSNQKIAERLLDHLSTGHGVVWPQWMSEAVMKLLAARPELAEYLLWDLQFLEVAAGHGAEFIALMDYHDKGIVRGMLWLERAVLEGQHGTKADSEEHGDVVVEMREQRLQDMVRWLNRYAVNDVLQANWGDQYIDKVRIVPGPLADREKQFFRQLIEKLLLSPTGLEMASIVLDLDAMLDTAGFPKAEEVVDVADALAERSAEKQEQAMEVAGAKAEGTGNEPDPKKEDAAKMLSRVFQRALKERR